MGITWMLNMVQPMQMDSCDTQVKVKSRSRIIKEFSRTQSDKSLIMETAGSVSSFSSLESLSSRSRDKSRSRDLREIPQPETSYSWRKNFNKNLEDKKTSDESKLKGRLNKTGIKEKQSRVLTNIAENFNHNQSPSMSILQIRLAGESRLRSSHHEIQSNYENVRKASANAKDVEKSTFDVDVNEKREIFEGKQDDQDHRPRLRKFKRQESFETATKTKTSRENWNSIRDKHCPITSSIVNQEKGESLRSSILGDQKVSFKNLKFTKVQPSSATEAKPDKSIASTKEFEDTATAILNQMRKQRRSLQMEYVSKVNAPSTKNPSSSWRDRISSRSNEKPPLKKLIPPVIKTKDKAKPITTSQDIKVETLKEVEEVPKPPKFTNPLDFILMKEEYVKKNPPKKPFVKQRDVESDSDGEMSMESVMKSLKKIVKAINPKREFANEMCEKDKLKNMQSTRSDGENRKGLKDFLNKPKAIRQYSVWDERLKKYYGASIVPFNSHASRWNSCQDLIEEQRIIDKKAVRERIKNRVLSSVHQALENKIDETFSYCESRDFNIKGKLNLKPSKYKLSKQAVEQESSTIYECVEYRKRELPDIIAHFSKDKEKTKKKSLHVKPTVHGLTDSKTGQYVYALITRRTDALWETVKPINVAVKIKTELFAPKSAPITKVRAKVSFILLNVAIITNPGYCGTTAYCEQHKWDNLRGCALFGIVGGVNMECLNYHICKPLVVNLPKEETLGEEVKNEPVFSKCERKPQSQLVKDVTAYNTGSLSRISFHYPPTFTDHDVVLIFTRFLRTKKDRDRYKFKQEEIIGNVIEGRVNDRRESKINSGDIGYLSYGTV